MILLIDLYEVPLQMVFVDKINRFDKNRGRWYLKYFSNFRNSVIVIISNLGFYVNTYLHDHKLQYFKKDTFMMINHINDK